MFEIGEEVKVRDNMTEEITGILQASLEFYKGAVAIIRRVISYDGGYKIDIDSEFYVWKEEWLERIEDSDNDKGLDD